VSCFIENLWLSSSLLYTVATILPGKEIMTRSEAPFSNLTPDFVLDAVESLGFISDARIYTLNSYENRVYQVGIENSQPLIAKFYRPNRWTDEQILEEHQFSLELESLEIPVVPPMVVEGKTLFDYQGYRVALFERKGGRAPELDCDDTLYSLGQYLGRIHAAGASHPFVYRPSLTIQSFGEESRQYLLDTQAIPRGLVAAYTTIADQLLDKIRARFELIDYTVIRLHGDCHPGNILWREDKPNFVDLDDARNGPAVQDLWMLLSGEPERQRIQLANIVEGYEMFCEFKPKELGLIESLRTLRLMHYAAWLARRWNDPAFPMHFPWFNTDRYWAEHINELREQLFALDQPSLQLMPGYS
jgi:Ser/Thr protein kinase RdoA (MazF antagonist)